MPVPFIKTWRLLVYNGSGVAIPANKITATLTPFTISGSGVLTPGTNITVIAASDGSPASAGIADGAYATSATSWVDNSANGYLGGSLFLKVDFTGLTPRPNGPVKFFIQNSCDGGTTWGPNGSGLLVPTSQFASILAASIPTDVVVV